jgi:hypothetical protein
MKRKTRFNDGGMNRNPFQGDDVDPFSAARDVDGGISEAKGRDLKSEIENMQGMYDKEDWEQKGPSAKPQSFKEAFAAAKDGSTFTWNGKSYKKEYADNKKSAVKVPPVSDSYRMEGLGRGRRADLFEPEATSRAQAIRADNAIEERRRQEIQKRLTTPGADAIETVSPESALIGGAPMAGLKTLHGAAKALAPYSTRQLATAAKEGIETAIKSGPKAGIDVAKSTAKGIKARAEMQAKRVERERAESGARKTAEAMESAKPILQRRPDTKSSRADRTRRSGEDLGKEFSKGGSAASRRADGCAMRGKTRGKIY